MQQSQQCRQLLEFDHTVKIILLGDFIVNKGILLRTLSELPAESEMKCLSSGSGVVDLLLIREGKRVRLRVNDTGGQERYRSITSSYYRGVHGCLLLFDVTKKSTFDSLHSWQKELRTNSFADDVVITLGGCNAHVTGSERQVVKRKAQDFASYLGVPYRELSVKNVPSIVQALEDLVDRILLKASRVPEFSTAITPLDQRLQNMQQVEKKAKSGTCLCV